MRSDPRGAPAQACSECLACTPLLAGADGPHHPPYCAQITPEPALACDEGIVVEPCDRHAFQSRAPPVLS